MKATDIEKDENISTCLSLLESQAVLGTQDLDLRPGQGAFSITDVGEPRSNDYGDDDEDGDRRGRHRYIKTPSSEYCSLGGIVEEYSEDFCTDSDS